MMVKRNERRNTAEEKEISMEAPQEQGKSRESNELGEAKDISQREVFQPLETRPATGAAFRDGEHLIVELLNTIGHEFRTPLAVIKGYSSMLLRHEEQLSPEERRELHSAIQEAGTQLGSLLDQVLELAQLEVGAVQLDQGTVDIPSLTHEAITKAQQRVPEQLRDCLTFHLHLRDESGNEGQDVPLVRGDPRSVHKLLTHLLENAIRFSPEGGRIDVIVQPVSQARLLSASVHLADLPSFLEICVCDYGIGIPDEHLERIFERFYRVDTSLTREVNSLGLGLALCRHLVALHHGRIWAESCSAGGSAFHTWLPMAEPTSML
jgi:signal transduction histidine kinase